MKNVFEQILHSVTAVILISNNCYAAKSADLNNSGAVDCVDYSILRANLGTNYAPADLNDNGFINAQDVAILKSQYVKNSGNADINRDGTINDLDVELINSSSASNNICTDLNDDGAHNQADKDIFAIVMKNLNVLELGNAANALKCSGYVTNIYTGKVIQFSGEYPLKVAKLSISDEKTCDFIAINDNANAQYLASVSGSDPLVRRELHVTVNYLRPINCPEYPFTTRLHLYKSVYDSSLPILDGLKTKQVILENPSLNQSVELSIPGELAQLTCKLVRN